MVKKLILIIYFIHLTLWSYAQNTTPFSYLFEITSNHDRDVHLYIDKNKSKIYNIKLKDLDENHPLYAPDDCESRMTLLAETTIDQSNKMYAIVYGYCPEPEFYFYDVNDLSKSYGAVGGLNLYIPGNGNLYVSGHVNSNFNNKRKFKFEENKITEVKQPLYYVGLETKTLKPLTLYKTKDMKDVVANLPENYNVQVLLAESSYGNESYYLIKTEFGLVGWSKIKSGQYQSIDVEGIFWNGD